MPHRLPALAAAVAAVLLLAAAAPAAAAPPGNWTFLRSDPYKHYACKYKTTSDERWRVRTASKGRRDGIEAGIGVYAAIARGSNRNVVREKTSTNWQGGWIYLSFRGLRGTDRLWIQAAAYGPAAPWSDGDRIGRLARCDIR